MASFDTIRGILENAKGKPEVMKELQNIGAVQFDTEAGKFFLKYDGDVIVEKGAVQDARVTISCADAVLEDVIKGVLNPVQAFITGKIKITGDLAAAQRLVSAIERAR